MTALRSLLLALLAPVIVAACTPAPPPEAQRRAQPAGSDAGNENFHRAARQPDRPIHGDLARDFMELSFQMESGRPVPMFTRFEGPVTLATRGKVPANVATDLDRLIGRLRREAGSTFRARKLAASPTSASSS